MLKHKVRECIRRGEPVVAKPGDTVCAAVKRMAEQACSSILVCEGEELRGIFTERDLLTRVVAAGRDPATTRLGEVMTPDPDLIEASEPVVEAVRRMDECGYRHLPVYEDDRVVGVISWRDVPLEVVARLEPELNWRHALAERIW